MTVNVLLVSSESDFEPVKDSLGALGHQVTCARTPPAASKTASQDRPGREARARFERDYISRVLQRHHGRMGPAAEMLGLERTNLYRKMKRLGIDLKSGLHAPVAFVNQRVAVEIQNRDS